MYLNKQQTRTTHTALLIVLLVGFSGQLVGESKTLMLRWEQLAPMVAGKEIELYLSDGTRLRGEALAVRTETFVMDVENTSNKVRYSKGPAEIPRPEVSSVNLIQRTIRWRLLATPAIGLAGAALGGAATNGHNREGLPLITIPASIAAGYFLGKHMDTHVTKITIYPN
jgi:hypothetical protein